MPIWISLLFGATVLATILLFHRALRSSALLVGMVVWTIAQSVLGWQGFYEDTSQAPPRILLFGVLPAVLFIVGACITPAGRRMLDKVDLRAITWLHTVRIPVEIVLWMLVQRKFLSPYMSVGGTNWDILSGLSAPLIAVIAFRSGSVNHSLLLGWNIVCTLLLFNVVITAALAIPSPMQQLAFDQPNVAVLHFPFNLLPAVVVPLVLFAHVIAFRRLRQG